MKASPPLRFLALVMGGWICIRAAVLAPGWREKAGLAVEAGPVAAAASPSRSPPPMPRAVSDDTHFRTSKGSNANGLALNAPSSHSRPRIGPATPVAFPPAMRGWHSPDQEAPAAAANAIVPAYRAEPGAPEPEYGLIALAAPGAMPRTSRWSASAWILGRDDGGGPALAPGGTLGGSQAGGRFLYRIGGGLALSARAYLPLRQVRGAEAAAGLDWQPAARLPVHILAERRQDLGGDGRSAFALSVNGGASRRLPHGLRLDAYGQAGIVGVRSRDLFADGSVRISAPAGPIEVGGGAWGGAQPGAARLDAGPSISWRLPIRETNLRLQADWRFRVAGDASPGSGPALTIAADF